MQPAVASVDSIKRSYRHATPYYEVVVLTSPARIERLAVDPSGRDQHFGVVNGFGPKGSAPFASYGSFINWHEDHCFEAGRPQRVLESEHALRLEGIPVGPH